MIAYPLVLLHAFPVDARMWDGVREPLAAHTRLLTPDQRGLGRSPLPETDRAPSLDDATQDLIALLDRLDLDKVVLGGCSMGGYLTMAMLRAAPQRVAGIVLIGTKASADNEEARQNRLAMARRVESEGLAWVPEAMLPALVGETTRARRPDIVSRLDEFVTSQPPHGVAWAQRAMAARPDSFDTLRAATVPALVLVGEEDTLTRVEESHAMVDALGDATLEVVPEAGHLSPLEHPSAVADALVRWFPKVTRF